MCVIAEISRRPPKTLLDCVMFSAAIFLYDPDTNAALWLSSFETMTKSTFLLWSSITQKVIRKHAIKCTFLLKTTLASFIPARWSKVAVKTLWAKETGELSMSPNAFSKVDLRKL